MKTLLALPGALLFVLLPFVAAPLSASASYDSAFLQASDQDVGRATTDDLTRRFTSELEEVTAVRLMPTRSAAQRLRHGHDPSASVGRAESLIENARDSLVSGYVDDEVFDDLDEARGLLLRSVSSHPRPDLMRDIWALRGLALYLEGEDDRAVEEFERLFEVDPYYRADPRVFPPDVREEMGEVLMSRQESFARVLSGVDAEEIGAYLGVRYVILGHVSDTGFGELVWRVDVFDLRRDRFIAEAEVHFEDRPGARGNAVAEVADSLAGSLPVVRATSRGVSRVEPEFTRPEPVHQPRGAPPSQIPEPRRAAPSHAPEPRAAAPRQDTQPQYVPPPPRSTAPDRRQEAFEPIRDDFDDETDKERRSRWPLWTALAVGVAAGGGTAAVMLLGDAGSADLELRLHR